MKQDSSKPEKQGPRRRINPEEQAEVQRAINSMVEILDTILEMDINPESKRELKIPFHIMLDRLRDISEIEPLGVSFPEDKYSSAMKKIIFK